MIVTDTGLGMLNRLVSHHFVHSFSFSWSWWGMIMAVITITLQETPVSACSLYVILMFKALLSVCLSVC